MWLVWVVALLSVGRALSSMSFSPSYQVTAPHCARTNIIFGQPSHGEEDKKELKVLSFDISLKSTVCFRLQKGGNETGEQNRESLLHTITLHNYEQHHPVSQKYEFAIPEVDTSCLCECSKSGRCSAKDYNLEKCTPDTPTGTCYRTFFANQEPADCDAGDNPRMCCQTKLRPHGDKTYTAVRIEPPSAFATFVYSAYDFVGGKWVEVDKASTVIAIGGAPQDNTLGELRVSVGGTASSHQLESGMYFTNANEGGETDVLWREPLNELAGRDVKRLGWYRRMENGLFDVVNGVAAMSGAHKAKATHCKNQTADSFLDAHYFVSADSKKTISFSAPVKRLFNWIDSISFRDGDNRQVIVAHHNGATLHLTLQTSSGDVQFMHNSSRLADFTGSIIMDRYSNRFLNLTLEGASGKVNGVIHAGQSLRSIPVHQLTVYVHEVDATTRSMIVPVPASIEEGPKLVCMHSDQQADRDALCRLLPYHKEALLVNVAEGTWRSLHGNCSECNEVSLWKVLDNFNPLKLVSGLSNPFEGVSKLTTIFVYLACLVIAYLLITKLIIPICQCWLCPCLMLRLKMRYARETEVEKRKTERERSEGKERTDKGRKARDRDLGDFV